MTTNKVQIAARAGTCVALLAVSVCHAETIPGLITVDDPSCKLEAQPREAVKDFSGFLLQYPDYRSIPDDYTGCVTFWSKVDGGLQSREMYLRGQLVQSVHLRGGKHQLGCAFNEAGEQIRHAHSPTCMPSTEYSISALRRYYPKRPQKSAEASRPSTAASAVSLSGSMEGAPRMAVDEAVAVLRQCRTFAQLIRPLRVDPERLAEATVSGRYWRSATISYVVDVAKSRAMAHEALARLEVALLGGVYATSVNSQVSGSKSGESFLSESLEDLEHYLKIRRYSSEDSRQLIETLRVIYPKDRRGACVP